MTRPQPFVVGYHHRSFGQVCPNAADYRKTLAVSVQMSIYVYFVRWLAVAVGDIGLAAITLIDLWQVFEVSNVLGGFALWARNLGECALQLVVVGHYAASGGRWPLSLWAGCLGFD
jgi:hypothetical protein